MAAYYNEIDPYAAQWLRNLIIAGHIAGGDVDERPIQELSADEIKGYTQCHFFAGIGGWSIALRLAGWPDDRPVWTGSCPCQPFSSAGKQEGHADERHLWPHWARLIRESKPPVIFGEQVNGAIAFGWMDEAFNDLEAEAYSCAAAVLPACSVGLPHKRDRLWFVANAESIGSGGAIRSRRGQVKRPPTDDSNQSRGTSGCGIMGDPKHDGRNAVQISRSDGEDAYRSKSQKRKIGAVELTRTGSPEHVAHSTLEQQHRERAGFKESEYEERCKFEWINCPDGKGRPVKPGICLLADGIPDRAHKLRAYGNAIVPQVAAEFIKASEGII